MRMVFGVLAALIGFAASAWAVLPPSVYLQARQKAEHHVQIAVTNVDVPWKTPGLCQIEGLVATVFRSKGEILEKGREVAFKVDCLKPGDEPMVGGTLWGNASDLKSARFIEAYLSGAGPERFSVSGWQYVIIPVPTNVPACPPDKPGLTCW